MIIDLHAHTNASDGVLSPTGLVQSAMTSGIDVLAVTDHDTIGGIEEAQAAAEGGSTTVLPGIEISCFCDATELHVLGLGIDPETPGLRDWLDNLIERRRERFHQMVQKCAEMGMPLNLENIFKDDGHGSVGRPHIARALVEHGYVNNVNQAFRRFLNQGQPVYVDRFRLDVREAIEKVHEAGGCAVQAHPGAMGKDSDIPRLREWGLDGLEAYHPDHDAQKRARYLKMTEDLDMIATGGSDYHGDPSGSSRALGDRSTPVEQFERLNARRQTYRPAPV